MWDRWTNPWRNLWKFSLRVFRENSRISGWIWRNVKKELNKFQVMSWRNFWNNLCMNSARVLWRNFQRNSWRNFIKNYWNFIWRILWSYFWINIKNHLWNSGEYHNRIYEGTPGKISKSISVENFRKNLQEQWNIIIIFQRESAESFS